MTDGQQPRGQTPTSKKRPGNHARMGSGSGNQPDKAAGRRDATTAASRRRADTTGGRPDNEPAIWSVWRRRRTRQMGHTGSRASTATEIRDRRRVAFLRTGTDREIRLASRRISQNPGNRAEPSGHYDERQLGQVPLRKTVHDGTKSAKRMLRVICDEPKPVICWRPETG